MDTSVTMSTEIIETKSSFEKSMIGKFECPVCFKYMIPPIRLCLSGHGYCTPCFDKLKNCALCRANKSPYRCILLEQIHASLTFPCKYLDIGCSYSGKGDSMIVHQDYCDFSSVSCPLRFNDCEWIGLRSNIINHCTTYHPDNIFFENEQKLKVCGFSRLTNRHYYILIYVFDTLFRCSWDLNDEGGLLRFAVYSVGKPAYNKSFCFKIGMFLKNTDVEAVSMIGPCYPLTNDGSRFIGQKYLSTNFDMIKDLCDTTGEFHYSIGIIDKNLELPVLIEVDSE